MMRLWKETRNRSTPFTSAALSIVAHTVLVGAAVFVTRAPHSLKTEWIENRAYFLPPPDRTVGQSASHETLRYITLAPEGLGSGEGANGVGTDTKPFRELTPTIGDMGRDLDASPPADPLPGVDSVFSELQVDSAVTRYPGSAAPAYPAAMLEASIQGSVITQYVVDTTGYADSSSLKVLRSTHLDFTNAVRAALPFMRFSPAKVGSRHVRQLVEQEFSFKIQPSAAQQAGRPRVDSIPPDFSPPRPRGQ